MSARQVVIARDPEDLAHQAARRFVAAARRAYAKGKRFTFALAGGSTPAGLYRALAQNPYREQLVWYRMEVFFGDERCVPPDHPDSNYRMALETLLDHVPLPEDRVYRISGERSPEEAADIYQGILRGHFRLGSAHLPHFDLIILGLGEDGHVASLFPGMPALDEARHLVVATPAPPYARPAVPRVTLTLPVLNAAREIMFLVEGARKADIVRRVLGEPPTGEAERLPAQRVLPKAGRVVWCLDQAAAAQLQEGI